VDTTTLVHPLAAGAEAYYRYALGDSVTLRLPGGARVPLRELRVTPRRADWKLSVGSFWFDARDGQLVRAVYRVTAPLDIWAAARASGSGPPAWAAPVAKPMTGQIDAVTIEHALHEGRFWLPRAQLAEGTIRSGSSRIGVRVEQRFTYETVNADVALLDVSARSRALRATRDSLWRVDSLLALRRDSLLAAAATRADSQRARRAYRAWEDSSWARLRTARAARDRDECAAGGARTETRTRYGARLGEAHVRVPCDTARLARAAVFDGHPLLGADDAGPWASPERAELLAQLGLGRQGAWAPQPVRAAYGPERLRANRVEGVSYGAALRRELGAGWSWESSARLGAHDLEPNAEAFVERADARRTLRVGAYRRLAISDDWGAGFAIGASIQNLLEGLDEQFYYRAGGVELAGTGAGDVLAGGGWSWRLFGERQWRARGDATLALPALFGADSVYLRNVLDTIPARPGTFGGAQLRWRATLAGDPAAPWRLATDARAEAAAGSFAWARAALDVTAERALPGRLRASVTGAAGTSAGDLPPQRWWNLGGWQSVRGLLAGSQRGDAFWNARTELRWQRPGLVQPAAFVDAGWAGDRARFGGTRPLRGAGGGVALSTGSRASTWHAPSSVAHAGGPTSTPWRASDRRCRGGAAA
jgi:hypothetical protein